MSKAGFELSFQSHGSLRKHGTNHGDVWMGTPGGDVYFAGGGTDTISGEKGNDRLHGGAMSDILDGQEDNDKLFGDAGDDFLIGNYGDDVLEGGSGADTFILNADYSIGVHTDKIEDFKATGKDHDKIDIIPGQTFVLDDLHAIKKHMTEHGGDVKFNFAVNNYVVFEHAHVSDFREDDFAWL